MHSHVGTLAPPGKYYWTCASAHPSPQPEQQIDRFRHFCTSHGRKSLYFTMGCPFPPKLPLPMGDLELHLTRFLGPIRANNLKGISIGSASFAQQCPYTIQRDALLPLKMPLPMGDLDLHLIRGSLDPPESSTQMASRSVQPFLQGSLVWQTDRPRYSVGNNKLHLCIYVRSKGDVV